MNRERAIQVIKEIIKENKDIGLDLGAIASAKWKPRIHEKMTPLHWKDIGYVSALSWAFDIKPSELKEGKTCQRK